MNKKNKLNKLESQKKKIRKNNMKKIMATTLASSIVLQSTTNVFADELKLKDNELSNIKVEAKESLNNKEALEKENKNITNSKNKNEINGEEKENDNTLSSKDENVVNNEEKEVEVNKDKDTNDNKIVEKENTNTANSNNGNSDNNEVKTDKEILNEPLIKDDKNKDNIKNTEYTDEKAFTFSNGTITDYDYRKGGYNVKIPPTIGGKPVTAIGDEAFFNSYLTSVVIPDGVISIGNEAFSYNEITSVEIPNSVQSIGDQAFLYNELTSVDIPNNIKSIGKGAFSSNNLTSVNIPNSIKAISDGAFSGNELTSIKIPDNITSIGNRAFSSNKLISVEIPNSVTSIGDDAFSGNKLTSIEIPNRVTFIGDEAFMNNKLTSIEIPNSVTSIGDSAFSNNELTSVKIPDSVTTIGDGAFMFNELTSVEIPNSIKVIGNYTFASNYLTSVRIPDSVTSIGDDAFSLNDLTSVYIPSGVKEIGVNAFAGNRLTNIDIPSGVEEIGDEAFSNNKLTSLEIPNSVTTLGISVMNSQSNEIKIRKYGDEYHANLKKLDPNLDPKKVKNIDVGSQDFTYDNNTGVIILKSLPKKIYYNYEVGNNTVTSEAPNKVYLSVSEAKKATVNYFIDDNLAKEEESFLEDTINIPDIEPKKGYTLSDWYKDNKYSNEWDFTNDVLTETTTNLYAKWIANEYTVKFDANDGAKQGMESQTFTYDKSGKLNKNTFTRPGYKFKGWSTTPNGEVEYADEAEVLNLAESGTVTLYAQWAKTLEPINMVPIITAENKVLTVGDSFNPLEGVTANDKEDGDISLTEDNIISNNVDMKQAGTYNVTYKVTDKKGASSIKTITVIVNPKMEAINSAPTITAEDKVLTVGDKFDPLEGVTANDKEDGEITLTEKNIISNNVDMSDPGTYNVTYKVTDKKGASSIKTITVTVNPKMEIINAIPTIKAEDKVLTVGEEFDPLEGVTAHDKEDGNITLTEDNIISNNVDMKQAGTYNVTYKVTDSKGASSIKTITVTVNPKMESINSAPIITAEDKVLTVGDEFNPLDRVTANDKEDGDITLTEENIISNNVDMKQAGTYNVTYKVTDKKGASSVKTITVTVNPKMGTINSIPTITAENKVLTVGDKFNPLDGVTANDKEDGDIILTEKNIISNSVDMSKAGTYNITYKVTDSKGASSIKTITVVVNPKMEAINSVPTITAEDKVLTVGDSFNPLKGVKATDKEDGDITLTEKNIISNNVDMSKAGTYNITYKVTDSNGASTVKSITIEVVNNDTINEPEISEEDNGNSNDNIVSEPENSQEDNQNIVENNNNNPSINNNNTVINSNNINNYTSIPETGDTGVLGSAWLGFTALIGLIFNNKKKKK